MTEILPWIVVTLGLLAALLNLVRRKWIVNIIGLASQYICVFILFPKADSILPAIIKIIVGLMATLVLYLTILGTGSIRREKIELKLSAGELFRGLSGIFLVILIHFIAPYLKTEVFPQSTTPILTLAFGLIILGLLQLGTKAEPLYAIIGLLTFMSGFELLYGSLEFSSMLEALFAMVNLLLALAGAYFIVKTVEMESK